MYLDRCIINLCRKIDLDFSTLVKISCVLSKQSCKKEIVDFFDKLDKKKLEREKSKKSIRIPKNFFSKNECVSKRINENIWNFLSMVSIDVRMSKEKEND